MQIDLHTHSTFSDGTLEPSQLIEKALSVGVTHLALCDHDSTEGLQQARSKAKELHLTLIPAVEINTKTENIHVLGYFVNEEDPSFLQTLKKNRETRSERIDLILNKLQGLGFTVTKEELYEGKPKTSLGRPNVADCLIRKGIVSSRQEAFERFLKEGRPAYIPHKDTTVESAIETILGAQGIPVVAHPGFSLTEETLQRLKKLGLQGIEVYYPKHSPDQVKKFLGWASTYDLVTTGGSDYHGPGSGHEAIGKVTVPENTVEILLNRKEKLFK